MNLFKRKGKKIEKANRYYNLQRVYAHFFHSEQLYNNLS